MDWKSWRGVVFLDPFATQVEWSTVERISEFAALDMWILFPTSAIARLLPRNKTPDEINPKWAERLNGVYGDQSWRCLYKPASQLTLFGEQESERATGVDGLLRIYSEKLGSAFGSRFMAKTWTLRNSHGSAIFEFLFCVGSPSPRAIDLAQRIAGHILGHLSPWRPVPRSNGLRSRGIP